MLTFFSWALEDLEVQSIIRTFQSIIQIFQSIINPSSSAGHSRTYESNLSFKSFPIKCSSFFSWALEDLQEQSVIQTVSNQSYHSPFFSCAFEDLGEQSIIQTFSINHSTFFSWALDDLGVQSIIQTFLQINYSRLFQSIIRPSSRLSTRGPRTAINHTNPFQSIIHPSS